MGSGRAPTGRGAVLGIAIRLVVVVVALTAEDGGEGHGEALEVPVPADGLEVLAVELCSPGLGDQIAAVDLSPACDAGAQARCAVGLAVGDGGGLGVEHGAGPDDAHLAAKDVDELGQFVERCAAQHVADRSDVGIRVRQAAGVRGADAHGAELVDLERHAVASDAGLPEQSWAGRGEAHDERDEGHGDAQDDEEGGRDDEVEHGLDGLCIDQCTRHPVISENAGVRSAG